jgi:Protein of unknown function (DUF2946)
MRRRLRKFLPIVLMALAVQILAPIAACWAASFAASDPLYAAVVCHVDASQTGNPTDPAGGHRAHDGTCAACCAVHAGASFDVPRTTIAIPQRQSLRVVWREVAPELLGSRGGSQAQARAPPSIS